MKLSLVKSATSLHLYLYFIVIVNIMIAYMPLIFIQECFCPEDNFPNVLFMRVAIQSNSLLFAVSAKNVQELLVEQAITSRCQMKQQ